MDNTDNYNKYIKNLAQTKLFSGIAAKDIPGLLNCVHARQVEYKKDQFIVEEGSKVFDFGIMLSGCGRAFKVDSKGKLIIITLLKQGSEIGVILAASSDHKSPVSVQAQEDSTVLMIPFDGFINRCKKVCPQHDRLLGNYINNIAEKGIVLHERIDCLLKPTVREKIFAYLSRISKEQGTGVFTIPLNRNAMAEYLNIERSSLSRELAKMKNDGLIDFHKNCFKLLL